MQWIAGKSAGWLSFPLISGWVNEIVELMVMQKLKLNTYWPQYVISRDVVSSVEDLLALCEVVYLIGTI